MVWEWLPRAVGFTSFVPTMTNTIDLLKRPWGIICMPDRIILKFSHLTKTKQTCYCKCQWLYQLLYHHCCILQLENRSKRPPEAPRECLTSELSGHTLPVVLGISLLIKTIQQRSVKSWIVSTKDRFQQKLLEKAYFAGYRSLDKSDRYWYFTQFTGYMQARSQRPEISLISDYCSQAKWSDVSDVIWWIFTSDQACFFFSVKGKLLIDHWDSEDCWFSSRQSRVVCTAQSVFSRVVFFRKLRTIKQNKSGLHSRLKTIEQYTDNSRAELALLEVSVEMVKQHRNQVNFLWSLIKLLRNIRLRRLVSQSAGTIWLRKLVWFP